MLRPGSAHTVCKAAACDAPSIEEYSPQKYRLFGERRTFDAWRAGKNRRDMMLDELAAMESNEPIASPVLDAHDSEHIVNDTTCSQNVRLAKGDLVILNGQPCQVNASHFGTNPPLVLLQAVWEGLLQEDPDFWSRGSTGSRYTDVADLLPAYASPDGRVLWLPWPQPAKGVQEQIHPKADAQPFNEDDLGPLLMKLRTLSVMERDPLRARDVESRKWLEDLRSTVRSELESIKPISSRTSK